MVDELKTKKIENFPENSEPADTDYFLNATGNVMKKTKVSQLITWLKEKLGINALNTKLKDNYMLERVDTVTVAAGDVPQGTITNCKTATFNRISDDAICIPVFRGAGWLVCTKYEISGNKLNAWFGCWSGSHSGEGTFDILQFVKVS